MTTALNHYLWGMATIEEATYDVSENLGLSGNGKLLLIPSSVKADDIAKILQNGYDVSHLHQGFRKFVKKFELDYLFVDTHPGLSKETLLSIATSHALLLILRPDKQDYQGTAVTVDVARQLKVRNLMLVLNKALSRMNFEVLTQKIEEQYQAPLIEIFPLSEDVVQLASEGVFCIQHPDHIFSQKFLNIAQQLMTE
jgi:MinD-like ATPase involved in chromosome partitioning or flagellar assembly